MSDKLSLANIFTPGMIIPRNKRWRLYGYGRPGQQLTVSYAGIVQVAHVDDNGKFALTMKPLDLNSAFKIIVQSNDVRVEIDQVRTGTVFLFSGQSNIEFRLRNASTYQETLSSFPTLHARFFEVPQLEYQYKNGRTLPADIRPAKWIDITENSCGEMSAVGFYAVAEFQREHPDEWIGVIDCYKGGTSASSWVLTDDLSQNEKLKSAYLDTYHKAVDGKTTADFDTEAELFWKTVDKHNKDLAVFQAQHPDVSLSDAKNIVGHTPWPPPMRPESYLRPGGLRETMIEPIIRYTISTVIWYQGENDTDNAQLYDQLLQLLITTWRRDMSDYSVPFYVVQLPGYADGEGSTWATIRQAQLKITQQLPYTHLVSFADTGEEHNIHPTNKKPVGYRLGRLIANTGYSATPILRISSWTDNQLELVASSTMKLVVRGEMPKFTVNNGIKTQTVLPNISGNQITISGDFSQVRYEDTNFPHLTMFNENGDPVSPVLLNREV